MTLLGLIGILVSPWIIGFLGISFAEVNLDTWSGWDLVWKPYVGALVFVASLAILVGALLGIGYVLNSVELW